MILEDWNRVLSFKIDIDRTIAMTAVVPGHVRTALDYERFEMVGIVTYCLSLIAILSWLV